MGTDCLWTSLKQVPVKKKSRKSRYITKIVSFFFHRSKIFRTTSVVYVYLLSTMERPEILEDQFEIRTRPFYDCKGEY